MKSWITGPELLKVQDGNGGILADEVRRLFELENAISRPRSENGQQRLNQVFHTGDNRLNAQWHKSRESDEDDGPAGGRRVVVSIIEQAHTTT